MAEEKNEEIQTIGSGLDEEDEKSLSDGHPEVSMLEKDDEEAALEKLVFGDDSGFLESLKPRKDIFGQTVSSTAEQNELVPIDDEQHDNLGTVPDNQLFFVDSGIAGGAMGSQSLVQVASPKGSIHDSEDETERDPPAWVDSEDERIEVSLASDRRLRKLRRSENEDLISGTVYVRRLRQQFERLHPVPDWAREATERSRRTEGHRGKRRRTSTTGSISSSENDDDDDDDDDDDGDDEETGDFSTKPLARLLQSSDLLTKAVDQQSGRKKLRQGAIDVQRSKDVGGTQPSAVNSLIFHPRHPLLLSSGPAGLITLFHLSPSSSPPNPTVHKLSVPRHPIYTAAFHPPKGESLFFASRRRYFHVWNLSSGAVQRVTRTYGHGAEQRSYERFKLSPCGRYVAFIASSRKGNGGAVNVLDAQTSQWVCQARVEGRNGVADLAWWRSGDGFVIVSKGGQVVEFSVEEKATKARWMDYGGSGATVLAVGGKDDRFIAVGSQSGIVNLYDRSTWATQQAQTKSTLKDLVATQQGSNDSGEFSAPTHVPFRELKQLTTPTSHLVFSDDGQLLVMSSRWKRDALRLVHLPSGTVYPNWPTSGTPLGRVTSVALSPGGLGAGKAAQILAVGNEAGKIRMWEIRG